MGKCWLVGLLVLVPFVSGMATCDKAAGIEYDPVTKTYVKKDGSPIETAGKLADYAVPGAGFLSALLVGIYAKIRTGQYKEAAVSTYEGIEEFKQTPEGAAVWDKMKDTLAKKQKGKLVKSLLVKAGFSKKAST